MLSYVFKNTISSYKVSQYFPKTYEPFVGDINVKVDLSNYATKVDIKNITHIDTSSFALKTNLASLKTEVDKLGIDKLEPVPVDLSKLSNVVKNDVVKKTVYNKLVGKVNRVDTDAFVLKTNYNTDKLEIENKILNTSDLVKKIDYNTKITEIEGKIPDVSSLVKKQIMTHKLLKSKRNLLIIIMMNMLPLHRLIIWLLLFSYQD